MLSTHPIYVKYENIKHLFSIRALQMYNGIAMRYAIHCYYIVDSKSFHQNRVTFLSSTGAIPLGIDGLRPKCKYDLLSWADGK